MAIDYMRSLDEAQATLALSREKLASAPAGLRDLKDLVGVADSEDGTIHAEYASGSGLSALDIAPRAMRLASQDLAEVIMATVKAAEADLTQRVQATLAAAGIGAENPSVDLELSRKRITALSERTSDLIRGDLAEVTSDAERARASLDGR